MKKCGVIFCRHEHCQCLFCWLVFSRVWLNANIWWAVNKTQLRLMGMFLVLQVFGYKHIWHIKMLKSEQKPKVCRFIVWNNTFMIFLAIFTLTEIFHNTWPSTGCQHIWVWTKVLDLMGSETFPTTRTRNIVLINGGEQFWSELSLRSISEQTELIVSGAALCRLRLCEEGSEGKSRPSLPFL